MAREYRPAPPPHQANERRGTIVITVAWAVALVVVLALGGRIPASARWWVWTCVAGVVMGLFGLWYVPRIKRASARAAWRRAERAAADGRTGQPWSSDSNTVSSTDTPGTSTRS